MKVNEIFQSKRKHWNALLHLRTRELQKDAVSCPACKGSVSGHELRLLHYICPDCQHYFPMPPRERLALLGEIETFRELYKDWRTKNPLDFPGYEKKLDAFRKKLGQEEAAVTGVMRVAGKAVAVGVLDGRFLMGSMGTVVGEKIARLAEFARRKKLPLLIFSASGGARMQEGLFSLMQMAKTAAAVEKFRQSGGLYISCLTNPTTGGVSASFASLGDIMLAEPDALIGFAGPRVIEQTIGQTLPDGFQRSEFLLEHGMLDMVVPREQLGGVITSLLRMHE